MDDPLSRALREDEEKEKNGCLIDNEHLHSVSSDSNDSNIQDKNSSLSISHSHNEWILPSTNERKEEVEINREQIKVFVCDPKKHKSNLDSFITYLITTQTYNDGVKINETNVRRRYNDFVWLKNILDNKYRFNIISPLPGKHTISKKLQVVADDGEFIRRRMIGLQNFLERIIDNPVIWTDQSVQLFLSADDDTFHSGQQQQQQQPQHLPSSLNSPVISTSSYPFRHPIGRGKPIPTEFSQVENQIQTLQDNLRKLERLSRKIEADQIGIACEEENLLSSLKQWLDVERKYDENDSLLDILCNTQQVIVDNQKDLLKTTNIKFLEPINDYISYTVNIQDVLKRRSQLSDSTTNNNSNNNNNNNNNEEMFDQLTIANETVKADVQRWNESKDKELFDLFYSMANKRVEYYTQSIDIWEQAAAKLLPLNNKK